MTRECANVVMGGRVLDKGNRIAVVFRLVVVVVVLVERQRWATDRASPEGERCRRIRVGSGRQPNGACLDRAEAKD